MTAEQLRRKLIEALDTDDIYDGDATDNDVINVVLAPAYESTALYLSDRAILLLADMGVSDDEMTRILAKGRELP